MADHADFLRRYASAQQPLFAYIRARGFGLTDAEDLLQDVSVALWESFSTYDPLRPFVAWALGVARNVVHKQQRSRTARPSTPVDPAILQQLSEQVAVTLSSMELQLGEEKERMETCIRGLPEKAQAVLRLRYHERLDLKAIADRIGQSYASTHMLLSRLRARLLDCVAGART